MKSRLEIDKASTAPTAEALNEASPTIKKGINMPNSTVATTNSATATPDLVVVDGQITTTSRQVADHFGKRHDTVLRAIRNLECSHEFHARNFAEMAIKTEIGSGAARNDPAYRITRDGFVFLAMGFTGKEAAQWKEAYITAFNKMEAELRGKTAEVSPAIDHTRISPAQAQDLKEIVQAIVEANIQGHGETWARLQRKFRVNSYLQLPASRYEEARQYLIAKLPAGYAGEVLEEAAPQQMDFALVESALSAANQVAAQIQQAAFMAMVKSESLQRGRWMVSFGYDAERKPIVKPVESNACVLSIDKFHLAIEDSIAIDPQVLMRLASTCMNKLTSMASHNAKALTA